jgi:hypothetical protein
MFSLGSISKGMSPAVNAAISQSLGKAGIGQSIASQITKIMPHVGGAVSQGSMSIKDALAGLAGMTGATPSGQAGMMGGLGGMMRNMSDMIYRMALVSLLQAALAQAQQAGSNPKRVAADVSRKLQKLQQDSMQANSLSPAELQNLMQKQNEMMQSIGKMMNQLGSQSQSIIQNMR